MTVGDGRRQVSMIQARSVLFTSCLLVYMFTV